MSTILITGASRGLGYELARQFAEGGDRVYATCRNPDAAKALGEVAAASEGRLTIHRMDVGEGASVKACRDKIGDVPIDILVNNAGVWGGLDTQTFECMDYDNWAYELNIMLMGPFRVTQAFMPNVLMSEQRKVVTITSQVAAHAYDHVIGYAYASAKAGLNRTMTALAQEFAKKGAIIALVHPGWIRTEMAGAVADLDPGEAAAQNIALIERLRPEHNGRFLKWTGDNHPW